MDYVIIGSTALSYWAKKYQVDYPYTPHDLDITSFDKSRLELSKLNAGDVVINDGTENDIIRAVLGDHYIHEDRGRFYLTPEALGIYYLSRPRLRNCKYPRYLKDVFKLRKIRYILHHRGTYAAFREKFYELGYNDFHLLFYTNKYFYRLNNLRDTDAVIAGDWAVLAYQELLTNTHHQLKNLDILIYNSDVKGNRTGSMCVPIGKIDSWNEIDGLKLEPLSSLLNKVGWSDKVRRRLEYIANTYQNFK